MKFSLMLWLLLLSSFAYAREKKIENKVIKCTMEIIENGQINQHVANTLIDFIKELSETNNRDLVSECHALKKSIRKIPYMSGERVEKLFVTNISMDQKTREVVSVLNYAAAEFYVCNFIGAEADIAIGLHLGFGVNVGQCLSSAGKRYVVVAPEFSIGFGLGVYALVDKTELHLKRGEKLHLPNDSLEIVVGTFYGASGTVKGEDENSGVGLGLGISLKSTATLNLKLIQIGRSYKNIRYNLGLDSDDVGKRLF